MRIQLSTTFATFITITATMPIRVAPIPSKVARNMQNTSHGSRPG